MLQVDIIKVELRYKNAFINQPIQRFKDQMRLRDDDSPLQGFLGVKMWAAMINL